MRAYNTENETAGQRANTIENALISQTSLQRMFGGDRSTITSQVQVTNLVLPYLAAA
jgi:hypothetical protein